MSKCASCGKELKFFNFKYSCDCCGKVYCSTCKNIYLQEFLTSNIITNIPQSLLSLKEENFSFNLHFFAGDGDTFCKNCFQQYARRTIETFSKIEGYQNISCYSKNYKGHIPVKKDALHRPISTPLFRNKQEAEEFLQIECKLNQGDIIYNLEFEFTQGEDGNYIYKLWKAQGIAAQKEDRPVRPLSKNNF